MNIDIFFVCVCVCLSLSLSVCISSFVFPIRMLFFTTECCVIFRTDGLVPNIWYQSIGGSSTRCRPPLQYNILFSIHLKKQRRKKANTSSNLTAYGRFEARYAQREKEREVLRMLRRHYGSSVYAADRDVLDR